MGYPVSKDKNIQKLTQHLIDYIDNEKIKFNLWHWQLKSIEAMSFFGGLPLFLGEAHELHKIQNADYCFKLKPNYSDKLILKLNKKYSDIPIFPIVFTECTEKTYFDIQPKFFDNKDSSFEIVKKFTMMSLKNYINYYQNNPQLLFEGSIPLEPLYEKLLDKVNNSKEIPVLSLKNLKSEGETEQ